jgi:hypothetical protein
MAYNVPAVCDVFAARIRALRSKVQGCKNVGVVSRGRRSRPRRTEPPERPKGAEAHTVLLCEVPAVLQFLFFILPPMANHQPLFYISCDQLIVGAVSLMVPSVSL